MLVNMSTTTSPVPGGTALSFNGSSSYVNLGSNSSLNITNQITVSAWVRVTAFTRFIRFVAKGRDTCESPYVDVVLGTSDQTYRTNDTMPRWTVAINGVQQEIVSLTNTPLSAGVWYHLVGTYNGSASILYVNGAQVGAISSLTGTVDSFPSNPFSLGQELNGCTSDPHILTVPSTTCASTTALFQRRKSYCCIRWANSLIKVARRSLSIFDAAAGSLLRSSALALRTPCTPMRRFQ